MATSRIASFVAPSSSDSGGDLVVAVAHRSETTAAAKQRRETQAKEAVDNFKAMFGTK